MGKIKEKNLIIYILVITFCLSLIFLSIGLAMKDSSKTSDNWHLASYGNSIALFNGDEIVEVYGAISLDTLPEADKELLRNGIAFPSKEEARMAIEDYDG